MAHGVYTSLFTV